MLHVRDTNCHNVVVIDGLIIPLLHISQRNVSSKKRNGICREKELVSEGRIILN